MKYKEFMIIPRKNENETNQAVWNFKQKEKSYNKMEVK